MVGYANVWGYDIIYKASKELNRYDKSEIKGSLLVGYKTGVVSKNKGKEEIYWAVNKELVNIASNKTRKQFIAEYVMK